MKNVQLLEIQKQLDHKLCNLSPELGRALREQVLKDSLNLGLWTEEDGSRQPILTPARPWLVTRETLDYLHYASWQIRLAMRALPNILNAFPEAHRVVPLDSAEAHWLYSTGDQEAGPGDRLFCRIDAVGRCCGENWQESLKFVETNVVGIGGMTYAPAASQALMNALTSYLPCHQKLVSLPDPRLLLMDELKDHARYLETKTEPVVALMDDLRLYRLGGEMSRLAGFLQSQGLNAFAADARGFSTDESGSIHCESREVDLIYRFLELRELDKIEETCSLKTLHRAFREGRMIPSMAGELDHKSCYELFTDPTYYPLFSDDQLKVFERHVLWTRLLFPRMTTDPEANNIDLLEYTSKHQGSLVIKPNRSYGGLGVILGPQCSTEVWNQSLEEAKRCPGEYVVQELAEVVQEELPFFTSEGQIKMEPCFLSLGLFPIKDRVSALGRFSGGRIVNISQNGGVVPLAVVES